MGGCSLLAKNEVGGLFTKIVSVFSFHTFDTNGIRHRPSLRSLQPLSTDPRDTFTSVFVAS